MKKLWGKRPSPAMIVAVLALSVSVAGTAVAAGVFSQAEKKAIKKLANKKITKRAGSLSVAKANVAKNVLAATFPQVNCTTTEGNTGGISAVPGGAGQCDVTFPRDVQNCTINVSPLFLQNVNQDAGGEATYRKLGGAKVRVGRYDSAGGTPTTGVFSISAVCPS